MAAIACSQSPPNSFGFASGDGSQDSPFIICTAAEMANVQNYVGSATKPYWFELSENVNLGTMAPLGSVAQPFYGNFNGKNHIIANWTYTGTLSSAVQGIDGTFYDSAGLFAAIGPGAVIQNLTLQDISLNITMADTTYPGQYGIGGIVGINFGGTLSRVGIQGSNWQAANAIVNCESGCLGGWPSGIGGLIGVSTIMPGQSSTITESWAHMSVKNNSTVSNTDSTSGGDHLGGLIGNMYGGTLSKSYFTGNIYESDTGAYVGGLIGEAMNTPAFSLEVSDVFATALSSALDIGFTLNIVCTGTGFPTCSNSNGNNVSIVGGLIGFTYVNSAATSVIIERAYADLALPADQRKVASAISAYGANNSLSPALSPSFASLYSMVPSADPVTDTISNASVGLIGSSLWISGSQWGLAAVLRGVGPLGN